MKLSEIEYDVIMQAINNAKNEIAQGTFIDPYTDGPKYSEKEMEYALKTVENKLIAVCIPT